MVVISLFIAVPLGWLIMTEWLANFEYSTTIHWWVFVLAGLTVLLIALITVSYESTKAAMINPARGLRSE